MNPLIMTIAYAGTIKLSKEGGEEDRRKSGVSFLLFFRGKKSGGNYFNSVDRAERQIEIAVRNSNVKTPFVVLMVKINTIKQTSCITVILKWY